MQLLVPTTEEAEMEEEEDGESEGKEEVEKGAEGEGVLGGGKQPAHVIVTTK